MRRHNPVHEQQAPKPVLPVKKKKPGIIAAIFTNKRAVIIGALVLILVISVSMWVVSAGSAASYRTRLSDLQTRYDTDVNDVWAKLTAATSELALTKSDLAELESELESVSAELTRLEGAKEINFGNGLKIFDIEDDGVIGKVQNISDKPMKKVFIFIADYNEEGSLINVRTDMIDNLDPQEVGQWDSAGETGASYEVYAFGNKDG